MRLETKNPLSTCSAEFTRGVKWLENEIKFDEIKIRSEIEEMETELEPESIEEDSSETITNWKIKNLDTKLKLKYRCDEVEGIYVLSKVGLEVADEFLLAARKDAFWEDDTTRKCFFNDTHTLWFLKELGLGDNPYFLEEVEDFIKKQSVEGYIQSNDLDHSGPLRVLVSTKGESKTLFNAVNYWLKNWKHIDVSVIAVGILALTELDFEKYSSAINEEADYLKDLQNDNGSWGKGPSIEDTSYAIWALSRAKGINEPSAQRGLEWLKQEQHEDGSWEGHSWDTAPALLALLAMGEGPKVPAELVDYQFMRREQSLRRQKPVFLHTSPLYKGALSVKELESKIANMLHNAKKEIRIASLFIDMFYDEITNLKQKNPNLSVKIITRPEGEAEGLRKKIAAGVIDMLNKATRGNVVQTQSVHSRMIIIDDEEVLISTADLTRDQLYDEFNAGIWTSDKETVKKAIEFFDNLFELGKQKEKSQTGSKKKSQGDLK